MASSTASSAATLPWTSDRITTRMGTSLTPESDFARRGQLHGSIHRIEAEVGLDHVEVVARLGIGDVAYLAEVPDADDADVGILAPGELDPIDRVGRLLLSRHPTP